MKWWEVEQPPGLPELTIEAIDEVEEALDMQYRDILLQRLIQCIGKVLWDRIPGLSLVYNEEDSIIRGPK